MVINTCEDRRLLQVRKFAALNRRRKGRRACTQSDKYKHKGKQTGLNGNEREPAIEQLSNIMTGNSERTYDT